MTEPSLTGWPTTKPDPKAMVLVLHGGRAHSARPTTARQLAYRRMVPIARSVHAAVRDAGVPVWLLRNRVRGWNEPDQDAVRDARWALARLQTRHPSAEVVLVGHSMGARAALRVAGAPGVRAVCALAPWLEPGEPTEQLAERTVLIAHGTRDRWTDPLASYEYAARLRQSGVRVCRFAVDGAGHAMLRRSGAWNTLVKAFVASEVGATPPHPAIQNGLTTPPPAGLRLPPPAHLR